MTRVLIVDDQGENRLLLRRLLESQGFIVDEAANGLEALDRARSTPPDVVVSDLFMPEMDGYSLLRRWKADEGLRAIPFVAYTATYRQPEDRQLVRDLGADAFVLRSAEPEELLARIREVLEAGALGPGGAQRSRLGSEDFARVHTAALVRKLEEKARELEQANGELAVREARLRAIIDTAPDCVKLVGRDGKLLEMNPAGLRMVEADSLEEVAGRSLEGLIAEDDRAAFRALCERVLAGETGALEYQITGLHGGRRRLVTRATPLRDGTGRITALLAITSDVTAARRAEAELREARERLQFAVDAGRVGLWDWDLRTDKAKFSREWKRQIGYDEDELEDELAEWQNRLHPDDLDRALAVVGSYLAGDQPDYFSEFRFQHKDGTYRHILARASEVRDASGRRVRLVGSHVDITESVELRAQLLQSQKMESLGRLAGGVAHDFNNLLTVIGGFADLALSELREGDPLRDCLNEIAQAGKRAGRLTRQLLAFSRRQILQLDSVNLNSVIAEMETMLRRLIGEDVELVFHPAPDLGCTRADSGQIEQVVMNLAVNARDAMPRGGRLILETRNVELTPAEAALQPEVTPGPHVLLVIRDTGTGMDEATRARIFEPFFTTKEKGQGSGLGLATVYGIVQQSRGGILVRSEAGQGTTFEICLPRIDAPPQAPAPRPAVAPARSGETILVVEDEEALRQLTARCLQAAGYEVLAARNGGEALLVLERHEGEVNLLLTDVVMPGMSGPELAARLAHIRPAMKTLYMSGYTDDEVLRHGVLDGAVHFLGKPFTVAVLAAKVREVLGS